MTTNIEFSIGILSWKGYDSLTNSLLSYQKNGLSKIILMINYIFFHEY